MTPEERLNICKKCPLWTETEYGPICNSNLYISKDGKKTSHFPKLGYVQGCNCKLNYKVLNPLNHCVINLW